ncbi:alpha/beta hydrolase [Flavilitoribacter nigricans]|uniref:Alpha/beta hydrolase n=1 Tax=Flavilitoribacter nigricans (strain ATCC 23147 / DSM 23189 / NBRC 102662 / NCIMB 1420 / SS-2) TaxID=1122177 RepID=A0A2D0NAM8_FLAN2|nr:alpha/beta fold hydrolase [Flavilitoribacter nigricans]PHN05438.1 alpha/beta hydrolase [Flavilitoribacter nigricans DSM 23189 = NBRC 102662]
MKKFFMIIGLVLLALMILFALGPSPDKPSLRIDLPEVSNDLGALETSIRDAERQVTGLKPDNESRIFWRDSIPQKTPYSIVYLHGFTASWAEGEPIHREFARRYGCNLYIPRLYAHGLSDKDAMLTFDSDSLLASAAAALAVGKQIGEKVILMSTSTGGTLSLMLAAKFPEIAGIIAYSPNIAIANSAAFLLNGPWGLNIAQMVYEGEYRTYDAPENYKKYWSTTYRLEALVELQNLLEYGMTEATFAKVTQPFFLGYYYKNEEEQDPVVSVAAMQEMFRQIHTPPEQKREVAFPTVGDHILASYLKSQDLDTVRAATFSFAEEVLRLKPQEN